MRKSKERTRRRGKEQSLELTDRVMEGVYKKLYSMEGVYKKLDSMEGVYKKLDSIQKTEEFDRHYRHNMTNWFK